MRAATHAAQWLGLVASLGVSMMAAAVSVAQERITLRAGALGVLHVDGRLDEPEWQSAPASADLVMVEPRPGNRPHGRGTLNVLAGPRALVFGIRCDDTEPAGIVSFTKERDGDFDSEDRLVLVLDPSEGLPLDGRVARSLLVRIVQMPTRLGARMRGDSSECWRSQEPYPFRNGYESCAIRPRISEPDYSDIPTRLLGYPSLGY